MAGEPAWSTTAPRELYRKAAFAWHPDHGGDNEVFKLLQEVRRTVGLA
jgi:hypothetical protein